MTNIFSHRLRWWQKTCCFRPAFIRLIVDVEIICCKTVGVSYCKSSHCHNWQYPTLLPALPYPSFLVPWWPRRYEHTSLATTATADLGSCEQNLLYLWLVSTPRPVLSSLSDPWHCASFKPNFCLFGNFVKPVNNQHAPELLPGKW